MADPSPDTALDARTTVLDSASLTGMDGLIGRLADKRVVFVGESHDQYEDHLVQLAIIRGLHARGKAVAIGMEFFQQPFQSDVDAYVSGRIEEPEFLKRTQYFDRWRFDYRLYRPLLRFARAQGIPVIALNLDAELTGKVGAVGLSGLTGPERDRIPKEIDRGDPAYRARLESAFKQHPAEQRRDFERFMDVQLLWDEGMAERAARYLAENPDRTLIVLAGEGHLEYGQGIPKRLLRRQRVESAIVLDGEGRRPDRAAADYFIYPERVELPAAGMLGIKLGDPSGAPGMRVDGFGDESGAKSAGMKPGDRILRIGGRPIADYADIRIALLDARRGQRVEVEIARPSARGQTARLTLQVELH